jgi:hypothetical protein
MVVTSEGKTKLARYCSRAFLLMLTALSLSGVFRLGCRHDRSQYGFCITISEPVYFIKQVGVFVNGIEAGVFFHAPEQPFI